MFKSTGIIISNPQSKSTRLGAWWVIVQACTELGRYYHETLKYHLRHKNISLQVPSWGYHISVVRGEKISNQFIDIYNNLNSTEVEFDYSHQVYSNKRYFWLNIHSECLLNLREHLGLIRYPLYDFHLTIGVNPDVKDPDLVQEEVYEELF